MSPLGSINPLNAGALSRIDAPLPKISLPSAPSGTAPTQGFGQMLDGLVATVDAKQQAAGALTRQVLLGDTDQLQQSGISMQEAGVEFSMLVDVGN